MKNEDSLTRRIKIAQLSASLQRAANSADAAKRLLADVGDVHDDAELQNIVSYNIIAATQLLQAAHSIIKQLA